MFPFPLPLLLDGATGTGLMAAGMPQGVCTEQWVLEHPDVLERLQQTYTEAGSQALYAPTFGANRTVLSRHHLEDRLAEMNRDLLALTKARGVLTGADLSPTGLLPAPYGEASFDEIFAVYDEQVAVLEQGEPDFYVIETMTCLQEARAALLAVKKHSRRPVFVTVTVDTKGRTLCGNDALACLTVLQGLGADAFGFNCSGGPLEMLPTVERVAPYAHVPLIVKPNAGLPDLSSGTAVFPLCPEEFAQAVLRLQQAGACIFGGCCGTTPAHISALKEVLVQGPAYSGDFPHTFIAANEREGMFLRGPADLSPLIRCTDAVGDDLLEAEDEGYFAAQVLFESTDDADVFLENAYLLHLPLAVRCDDAETLEYLLTRFCGRALLAPESQLTQEQAEQAARKFGLYLL